MAGGLPPGEYTIALGLYRWDTGERLEVVTPNGAPLPDGRYFITGVVVP